MTRHSLLLLLLLLSSVAGVADDASRKLCWCHLVRWGFFQLSYDEAGKNEDVVNPATDRTLLGKLTQERQSFWGNAKAQIQCARQYGIDGFCVDMVDPKSYLSLGDFLHAAEGTDFKIALCMDNYVRRPVDYCVEHLGNFLRKYYHHPNQARVQGKPVIFLYNTGLSTAQWQQVVEKLREQKLEAYYLVRASFEWEAGVRPNVVAEALSVNDGLYDFGCCGFSPVQMQKRLGSLASGLDANRPEGLLVAGVVNGYLGRAVGHYRPFRNSLSTMHNWEAILANPRVNWVCITTWNDYTETTHIEPSVVNRDSLALLNQEYIRQWKGQPRPSRPAQPILTYHEEVTAGHDLTFESLSFPYDCGDYAVDVRIVDAAKGALVKGQLFPLPKEGVTAQTMRLSHKEMKDAFIFRVYAKVINRAEEQQGVFANQDFVELHPVVRRVEHVESQRTIRLPLQEVLPMKMTLTLENGRLWGRIHAWEFGGRLELLRNGYPVEMREMQHGGAPLCKLEFALPKEGRSPMDVYLLRFTNVSGNVAFSNPATHVPEALRGMRTQTVIVPNADFEEDWPLWPKRPAAHLETMQVPEYNHYRLCYLLEEGEGRRAHSSTDWKIPLCLGEPGRGYHVAKGARLVPEWVSAKGPHGEMRKCLKFFGDSVATLPVRTMPIGIFTMEAWICPEASAQSAVLFGEQKPYAVSILPDGRIAVDYLREYKNPRLESTIALKFGEWSHVAVVCQGDQLALYINGKPAGSTPIVVQTMPVNSLPALGNLSRRAVNGYRGLMAGFAVAGEVLAPEMFQLQYTAVR